MNKEIIDGQTGEMTVVEMTAEELEQYKADMPETSTEETVEE